MKKHRLWLLLIVMGLLVATAVGIAADWLIAVPPDAQATYVGRQTCAKCHQAELHAWQGSHHDKAMDLATADTVLADFHDATFTYQGVTSRMFRQGEKFLIHTEGPDGKMADFEVKYVFGFDPLQQYMVAFPDGRVQVLRISWDTVRKRWFYQYPPGEEGQRLKHDDIMHWTNVSTNWNHMCADCHSTDLQKNYDVEMNRYHTTFSEIDVSCETCHGPGSIHVELAEANSLFWDRNHGYGLPTLKHERSKFQIETCAKCHARRSVVYPDFQPGQDLLDYYVPELLNEATYHADGQILDEVYVYGSFLQSKMHAKGVRCTDCHNPHTTQLRHEGSKLCTSCHQHPTGKYDVPAHHHHKPGTPGAQCVECHMPAKHYMIVDPRRDHSLRVPRPDLSVDLGTPNACTACHLDTKKSDKWEHYSDWLAAAAEGNTTARDAIDRVDQEMLAAVNKWYGTRKDKQPHYAYALQAARKQDPDAEEALTDLLNNRDVPAIVKATAIQHLADFNTPTSRAVVISHISDPDPLIRTVSIRNLGQRGYRPQELIDALGDALSDPVRAVRVEAAQVLAPMRDQLGDRKQAFRKAIDEYRTGQYANSDQPGAHVNLGNLAQSMGAASKAVEHYETALAIAPEFAVARLYLGYVYSGNNQKDLAEKQFRLLAEQQPDAALPRYRLGLVLGQTGRFKEAEKYLLQAHNLEPGNFDYMYGLGVFYLDVGDLDKARNFALELLRLYPEVRAGQQLMSDIFRRAQQQGRTQKPAPETQRRSGQ